MTPRQLIPNKESGFTLVELAIVMIIIGLLIGGILKGQELVANAQTTATVAQIKGLDGAIATFRDKYSQYPGDMRAPNTRLRDCTSAPCSTSGNGNGRVDTPSLGAAPTTTTEGSVAMVHLAASDLISGVTVDDNTLSFGAMLPEAKIGGGFWMGHTANGSGSGVTGMRPGHYLVMNGTPTAVSGNNGGLTATQAAQIDRKIDDGDPDAGSVQAPNYGGCITSNEYSEAEPDTSCGLYIRVQG